MLKKLFLLSLFTALMVGVSHASTTGDEDAMTTILCNVYVFITGGIGKTICSFVIIGVGIGFFTGKVSWGTLIGVALGIASLFGGPSIMAAVTGTTDTPCKNWTRTDVNASIDAGNN